MQRGGTGANFWALNGPHHCPGTASTSKLVLRQAGRILAPSESPPEGFLFGKELEFAQLQKDGNGGQELRLAGKPAYLNSSPVGKCLYERYGFETVRLRWLTEAITTHHMLTEVSSRCDDDRDRHCVPGDLPTCMKQMGPPLLAGPCNILDPHQKVNSRARSHERSLQSDEKTLGSHTCESRQVCLINEPKKRMLSLTLRMQSQVTRPLSPFSARCRILMTDCGPGNLAGKATGSLNHRSMEIFKE
ncbi:unnamed protein product [Clonostachys chloroleuca]|uniref:Uncharacterized protein n=1 Tax=Clonostachys chloroleuca TaxID=1926264 RepID=A0AA35MHM8_9HYPO|nr:unnamed protein product [Clonostachys chloroleuca]